MLLKTRGKAHLIHSPIVGKVTRDITCHEPDRILITEQRTMSGLECSFYKAILTTTGQESAIDMPSIYSVPDFSHLSEGDIVVLNSDGLINTLYRVHSSQNTLLFTERCNSNCLMCSQPPKNRNDVDYLYNLYTQLIPLIPKDCIELGISGGEPTLMGNYFFELLRMLQSELPNTEIHCLSNGRSFAWDNMSKKLGKMNYRQLMLGIPLYSDYYQQHDYIVQAKNAFYQTVQGLYNLASVGQRIEIRIVLHKQTISRLHKFSQFLYKNFPFVEHIAFMGLEYQGYTPHNIEKLWVDPVEYMDELRKAVDFLSSRGLSVSIYNTPLCLMPQDLWTYSRKSISDWKNSYLPLCNTCSKKDECGGFFTWNLEKHSDFVHPI